MSEAVKKAIAARGQCKASITRLEKYLQTQSDQASYEDLIVRKQNLKETWSKYLELTLVIVEDPENDDDDMEERVLKLFALLEKLIRPHEERGNSGASGSSHGSANLPSLDIATFDGRDPAAYKPFIEMFIAVVHSDTRITAVKKFCFLKRYLKGEPLQLIDNLPVVGDSYSTALDLLKKRYDNPALITCNHINTLLDIPKMLRGTAQQLRDLVAKIKQQIAALKNLGQPVEAWDSILACIVLRKIDAFTARLYHSERDSSKVLDVDELLEFLTKRAIVLEASPTVNETASKGKSAANIAASPGPSTQECQLCSEPHRLFKCPKFGIMSVSNRISFVTKHNLCKICLGTHTKKCRYNFKCTTCNSREHNSLIHETEEQLIKGKPQSEQLETPEHKPQVNLHTYHYNANNVILPTAKVIVSDAQNNKYVVRALLDCGSQTSFCTTELADKLQLKQFDLNKSIVTLGTSCSKTSKAINITVQSMVQEFKVDVTCSIIDRITTYLPQAQLDITKFNIPSFIKLADNEFSTPGGIDLLLSSDIFFRVVQDGKVEGGPQDPVLLNTRLGYVVSGSMNVSSTNINTVAMFVSSNSELDWCVKQFWETEKVPEVYPESIPEHEYSEKTFRESVSLQDNRFQVKIPLKVSLNDIEPSDSFIIALQRFYSLEKRFSKDPYFHELYKNFIKEYVDLGHAKFINMDQSDPHEKPLHFLPHHAVLRPERRTNKLRVVFDGSAKNKGGHSLNDLQCNGPVVQKSLFDILLLFRTYKYTIQCDVRHMYRMILIHPDHRPLQNILWREDGEVKCLQLQTITYGLKSSAFLATRCLIELANKYKDEYPLAHSAILNNSYVDDIQGGSDTLQGVLSLKKELIMLMELGGFTLHKWVANNTQVLLDTPKESLGVDIKDFDNDKTIIKILGLSYDARNDIFKINGRALTAPTTTTKRTVLSSISRLFDPVGFAGPITVKAKLILQQIWQYKELDWDTPLPVELVHIWENFYKNLSSMPDINIPRYVQLSEADEIQLIGYCDASTDAYGCCVYLKVRVHNEYRVFLLCSKSRVAPLGSKLTIPKLELNGALLLAKLISHVASVLHITTANLFCDSKIVLGWLNSSPITVPAYIGNRIKEINKFTDGMSWYFTPGLTNPADILSRGADPQDLIDCKLWQQGPDYLIESNNYNFHISEIEQPFNVNIEVACHHTTDNTKVLHPLFERFSSLFHMTRVMARILRFINSCKGQTVNKGMFTVNEYQEALLYIIKGVQNHYFHEELQHIEKRQELKSNLKALSPFIDGKGLLRVGGRLDNAINLNFSQKHPIILPKHCHVSRLIIRQEHLMLMHGGLKLVLSNLSQKYYLINAVREVKAIIHKCVSCCRHKAVTSQQLMGSLPDKRVTAPARVFENVGLDYCGPFDIKQSTIRRSVVTKGYVAVFVCFASKAVHLEVVSDMSTDSFLAALNRFISRRGIPANIYCDNGSTFKGANNKLKELYEHQSQSSFQNNVNNFSLQKNIQFHFIPAYSPNHGGLWEAAVKSAKHHLKRIATVKVFTYEQFNTIIIQIEGILNSRPLTPLTQDPSDFTCLTPGHFIIGSAITSIPQPNLTEVPANRLRFWRCCEQIRQHFWAAWSKDYLSLLNTRTKWQKCKDNLKVGMLVLLHSNNHSPIDWPMGRIVKVFHGKDNMVRVVEIQTADKKIHSRAVSKIVVLPVE